MTRSRGPIGGSAVFNRAGTGQGYLVFAATGSAAKLRLDSSVAAEEKVVFSAAKQGLILGAGGANDFGGLLSGFNQTSQLSDVNGLEPGRP